MREKISGAQAVLVTRAKTALAELREMSLREQARMAQSGVTEADLVALISQYDAQPKPLTR
jgi:hypothetical protein